MPTTRDIHFDGSAAPVHEEITAPHGFHGNWVPDHAVVSR